MMENTPEWVLNICDEVVGCIEGLTFFETRYFTVDESEFEGHLIEIAPAKLEIAEAGENDGEEIYDPSFDVDLLELESVFESVEYFHSQIDPETHGRMLALEATYRNETVFFNIRTVPFEDAVVIGRIMQGGKFEFFNDIADEE